MKTIIAATDFSDVSLNAVRYAANMAAYTKSQLVLFHVCELPLVAAEVPVFTVNNDPLVEDVEQEIKKLKKSLEESTKGVTIFTEARFGTSVLDELRDYCTVTNPFAVIIGSDASSDIEKFFTGNTATTLARYLKWPLLVVPPSATFTRIKNIALASDFESVNESTPIDEIKFFVQQLHASLHVLHVNKQGKEEARAARPDQFRAMRQMLKDLHPVYHMAGNRSVDKEIVSFIALHKIDLLIIIPKRHNLLDSMVHRSRTKQLVSQAPVPVMAIHE